MVVAQGCRPVGPAFGVTEAEEPNIVTELDSRPAMDVLSRLAGGASAEDRALIEAGGILCGLLAAPGDDSGGIANPESGDYLIRQIVGFRGPGMILSVPEVRRGDVVRFHVRDGTAARDDLGTMAGRYRTERLFAGGSQGGGAGMPLAAVQVSCIARGRSLFGEGGIDLAHVTSLLGGNAAGDGVIVPPVAGFYD